MTLGIDREAAADPSVVSKRNALVEELIQRRLKRREAELDAEKAILKAQMMAGEESAGARGGIQELLAGYRQKHNIRVEKLRKTQAQEGGAEPQPAPQIPEIPINVQQPKGVPGFAQNLMEPLLSPGGPQNVQQGQPPGVPSGGPAPAPSPGSDIQLGGGPTGLTPTGVAETTTRVPAQPVSGWTQAGLGLQALMTRGASLNAENLQTIFKGEIPESVQVTQRVLYPTQDDMVSSLAELRLAEQAGALQPGPAQAYLERLQSQLGADAAQGILLEAQGRSALLGQARSDALFQAIQPQVNDLIEAGFDGGVVGSYAQAIAQGDYDQALQIRASLGQSRGARYDEQAARLRLELGRVELEMNRIRLGLTQAAVLQSFAAQGSGVWELTHPGQANPYLSQSSPLLALSTSKGSDPGQLTREDAVKMLSDLVKQDKGLYGGSYEQNPAAVGQFQEAARSLLYVYDTVALYDPGAQEIRTVPLHQLTDRVASLSGIYTEKDRTTPVQLGGLANDDGTLNVEAIQARHARDREFLASMGLRAESYNRVEGDAKYRHVSLKPLGDTGKFNQEILADAAEAAAILAVQLPSQKGVNYAQIQASLLEAEQRAATSTWQQLGERFGGGSPPWMMGPPAPGTTVPERFGRFQAEQRRARTQERAASTEERLRGRTGGALGLRLDPEEAAALREGRVPPAATTAPPQGGAQLVPAQPDTREDPERLAAERFRQLLEARREAIVGPPTPVPSPKVKEGALRPPWLYPPTVFPRRTGR